MSLPYFTLFTSNWRDGVRGLKADEVGVYINVLTLIYDNDGAIPDDDATIAEKIGFDIRLWRRVRQRLIDVGKLLVKDGQLSNKKAGEVIAERLSRASIEGRKGFRKGAPRTKKGAAKNQDRRHFSERSPRHLRDISEISARSL